MASAKKTPKTRTLEASGQAITNRILKCASEFPGLKKRGPQARWQAEVEWVGAKKMAQINFKFRGKNKSTDVLSFPAPQVFRNQGILGDLVLCREVLVRQAREQRHALRVEFQILVVHGVLHLLGLDHEVSRTQATQMARWETKILQALRVKPASRPKSLIARNQ